MVTVALLATNDRQPGLTGSIGDASATITVEVDGQTLPATNEGTSWSLPAGALQALADGSYDVRVTAEDALGNVGADGTVDELFIDATPPSVSVIPLQTDAPQPALRGLVDDPGAVITVTIDGVAYAAQNTGMGEWFLPAGSIAPLEDGTYDVNVQAVDALGNAGSDSTAGELEVDTTTVPLGGVMMLAAAGGLLVTCAMRAMVKRGMASIS